MKLKSATEWFNRHIDAPAFEETDVFPIDLRRLMCAMFERAWYDLDINVDVNPAHRRSAIAWFRGIRSEPSDIFSFKACSASIGFTASRYESVERRIRIAEQYIKTKKLFKESTEEKKHWRRLRLSGV